MPIRSVHELDPFTDDAVVINGAPVTSGGRVKRFTVCCDGTWKSSDQTSSKMNNPTPQGCAVMAEAETQQVLYYQMELGTGAINTVQKQVVSEWRLHIFQTVA
jgi:hypothetical protein